MTISKQKGVRFCSRLVIYTFLIVIGFIYLYPILMMISASGKDLLGLSDPRVRWVPTTFVYQNYATALDKLGGMATLWRTVLIMGSVALAQTLSSAVVAYGFAKGTFKGKNILFVLMIVTFFIPQHISFLSRYVIYNGLNWIGTVLPVLMPALFGQGMKHALFILLFYQFYKLAPPSLDEAASIDGASNLRIFTKINLRMAIPAAVTTFVLSFVWNWNEIDFTRTYFGSKIMTFPIAMQVIKEGNWLSYLGEDMSNMMDAVFHTGLESASVIISILPLIAIYILFERRLVESIDMSGITGE